MPAESFSYLVNVITSPSVSFITFRTRTTFGLTNTNIKTTHARETGAIG